jgi:hypothetical protein
MPLNYDRNQTSQVDPTQFEEAKGLGLKLFNILCCDGTTNGYNVSFVGYGDFVPRVGERIGLQDGKTCVVESVVYAAKPTGDTGFVLIVPNVYATLIAPQG